MLVRLTRLTVQFTILLHFGACQHLHSHYVVSEISYIGPCGQWAGVSDSLGTQLFLKIDKSGSGQLSHDLVAVMVTYDIVWSEGCKMKPGLMTGLLNPVYDVLDSLPYYIEIRSDISDDSIYLILYSLDDIAVHFQLKRLAPCRQ